MRLLRGDLHTHTTASDGVLTSAELVAAAKESGLSALAVTDHETTDGWPDASTRVPRLIGGVEVATTVDDQEFHLLGYFAGTPDITARLLAEIREGRRRRFEAMLKKLQDLGIDATPAVELPSGNASPGRPHVARALVRMGLADSVPDAFRRYLAEGGPAYVGREKVAPLEVIEAVHADFGIVSLAHPGQIEAGVPWRRLADWGLDAIEVYHPTHPPAVSRELLDVADAHQFLVTGGSDFHDPALGSPGLPALPEGRLLAFLAALDRRQMIG